MGGKQVSLRAHEPKARMVAALLSQAEVFDPEAAVMSEQPFRWSVARAGEAKKLPDREVDQKRDEGLGKLGDR